MESRTALQPRGIEVVERLGALDGIGDAENLAWKLAISRGCCATGRSSR
jgi:hypothetical protein